MIQHDELCHSFAFKVTGFLAARDILGHFVSRHLSGSRNHSRDGCATSCNIGKMPKTLRFVALCCIALHAGQKKRPGESI